MDIKRFLCIIFILLGIGGLCPGCGNSAEETMAQSAGGPEQEMAESGAEKSAEETTVQSVGGLGQEMAESGAENSTEGTTAQSAGGPEQEADAGHEAEKSQREEQGKSVSDNDVTDGNKMRAGEDAESEADVSGEDTRPDPVKVKGIYVSGPVAGIAKMDELIDLVDRTELNAMVIDVKNDEGKVTYKMESEQVQELEASIGYIPDIDALVDKCKEKNIYLIARIVAFRDPYLAEKKPEWAVHGGDGEVFRDKNGMAWVNPYRREVWDYLAEIASQAAADGFDEVQFDYIRFSTDIGEDEADYGPEAEKADKLEIITEFTKYLYAKLAPCGVYVAADVFGTVIDNETDQKIVGQDYVKMAENLDYICPMVYPSHYYNGAYGIAVPDADPYATIHAAASSSARQLKTAAGENRAHVRLWLQSFTASWVPNHISYGPAQIREQIKGAYDAGYEEWILWNAAVNYQPDSLLTPEEAEAERQRWEAERLEADGQESVSANSVQAPAEAEPESVSSGKPGQ